MNIIELARQAGARDDGHRFEFSELKHLEWFAKLVIANIDPKSFMTWQGGFEAGVAKEREECAKFCETNQVWVGQGKRGFSKWGEEDFVAGGRHQGMDYAGAIRARSKA